MKTNKRNFNILSNYTYFTPDARGTVILLLWFFAGALLGNIVAAVFMLAFPDIESLSFYSQLVAYPMMFIPPMMYASLRSKENSFFRKGFSVSNDHYKPVGGLLCVILVIIGTLCTAFIADMLATLLPDPPKWLTDMLESLTTGDNLLLNFILVSVMAPFFEEWLCRGMFLRGLLNCERRDKQGNKVQGIKPVWAIVISAALFAFIHMNPWQAVPAFMLGCVFGYVYYRTGSIKLTMLMHCANNTFALVLSNIDSVKDAETFSEVMSTGVIVTLLFVSAAFLYFFFRMFQRIPLPTRRGNCDEVLAEGIQPDPEN